MEKLKAKILKLDTQILCRSFNTSFTCKNDEITTEAFRSSEQTQPTTDSPTTNLKTTLPVMKTSEQTQPTTDSPTTNLKTAIPTFKSSVYVTPTKPQLPSKSIYRVIKDSTVCLIMEGRFQLQFFYIAKENVITRNTVNIPESGVVSVTGTCARDKSSLIITPKDGVIEHVIFQFQIDTYTGKSMLMSLSAAVNLELFPNAKEAKLIHTVRSSLPLSDPRLYYKCDVGGNFSDDKLTLHFKELKVQAFHLEDGRFSKNGEDCKADLEPIPGPGSLPVNTFSVTDGSNTCIVFKGSIQFNIPYVSKFIIFKDTVPLPAIYSVTGDCNTILNGFYSQKLVISFYDTWALTMYFSSDTKQKTVAERAEEGVTRYKISRIEFSFDYDNVFFKYADDRSKFIDILPNAITIYN
ncbi:uncharacterized protein LOC134257516 [Saccostrea cucullata]|uniref:uncharacterized protein LOC134257516 n=1 Tax=Saccostrea cuccullata TaxID=36930 RepID=UPI002ED6B616